MRPLRFPIRRLLRFASSPTEVSQTATVGAYELEPPRNLTVAGPLLTDWQGGRKPDRGISPHGTAYAARPIRCVIGSHAFLTQSSALPLPDKWCEEITCFDVLEYVRDDEALIAEFARVLQPGGMLRLRVPNAGPLAGLDAFNLYRYLVDITKRGAKPKETAEVGWRRHYGRNDLAALLTPRFRLQSTSTQRVGIGELLRTISLVVFRWLLQSDVDDRRVDPLIRRLERIEDKVKPGQVGTLLTIEAVRLPEPP